MPWQETAYTPYRTPLYPGVPFGAATVYCSVLPARSARLDERCRCPLASPLGALPTHYSTVQTTVVGVGLPPPDLRNTFGLIALCIAFRPGLRALHSALRFTWWLAVGVVPYGIHVQYHSLRLDSL